MISTRLDQALANFDEMIDSSASDYARSGLKAASAIRIARLAVVENTLLLGSLGEIDRERLRRIRNRWF